MSGTNFNGQASHAGSQQWWVFVLRHQRLAFSSWCRFYVHLIAFIQYPVSTSIWIERICVNPIQSGSSFVAEIGLFFSFIKGANVSRVRGRGRNIRLHRLSKSNKVFMFWRRVEFPVQLELGGKTNQLAIDCTKDNNFLIWMEFSSVLMWSRARRVVHQVDLTWRLFCTSV